MKLLSTVAAGALLLAGCAPFEHGHYADDVNYINDVGDRPGTPVLVDAGYDDSYHYGHDAQPTYVHSQPASYSEPVYSAPAPIQTASYVEPVQQYAPPPVQVVHSAPHYEVAHHEPQYDVPHYAPEPYVEHHAPQPYVEQQPYIEPQPYIEQRPYVEPARTLDYAVADPTPKVHVEIHNTVAPAVAPLPAPRPIQYVEAQPPIVAATSVSVQEERYIGETRYAPPEVINAPPVYMRGPGQFSNQPYPAPAIPQFGAPAPGYAPQGFGFPPPQTGFGYGNPYGMPVAANARPAYGGQGYGAPYGNGGCVTTCGGASVF